MRKKGGGRCLRGLCRRELESRLVSVFVGIVLFVVVVVVIVVEFPILLTLLHCCRGCCFRRAWHIVLMHIVDHKGKLSRL